MAAAPAVSKAVAEQGKHFAHITVFLDSGQEVSLRGPARRNRQEALKDCLELRKIAVKSTDDPSLFEVRQRKRELEDITWTVKDIGGRMLDGAEGPPPGYAARPTAAADAVAKSAASVGRSQATTGSTANKFRGIVKGNAPSMDAVVEVADIEEAVPGSRLGGAWVSKAKVALQQAFKRFGPVMEVRVEVDDGSSGGECVSSVRFASAKAAELAMTKAIQGYLPVGTNGGQVRLRQPSATEAVWRKFPPPRRRDPALEGAPKKKLRPNERFATKIAGAGEGEGDLDESERFWEEQKDRRGMPAEPPPALEPPPPQPDPVPEKPVPAVPDKDASDLDKEVCHGEEEVAKEMSGVLELPFSQQKKALKSLRRKWHPDKNPDRVDLCTRVFHFIQSHDEWLAHHDLA